MTAIQVSSRVGIGRLASSLFSHDAIKRVHVLSVCRRASERTAFDRSWSPMRRQHGRLWPSVWLCSLLRVSQGQPHSPAGGSSTLWEAFNAFIDHHLSAETTAAYREVYKPDAPAYKEHALNLLTAEALHQKMAALLDPYRVYFSVLIWEPSLPDGYKVFRPNRYGVAKYMKCLHLPAPVGGAEQLPCGEGGSVLRTVRSHTFRSGGIGPGPQVQVKRVMLFYTPVGVHGPDMVPDIVGHWRPTATILAWSFKSSMRACKVNLSKLVSGLLVDLDSYAKCISDYFEANPYENHTALRGVALVPEVVSELPGYSAPGRCSPLGGIFATLVDLPAGGENVLAGEMKLWIIANVPVVVVPASTP